MALAFASTSAALAATTVPHNKGSKLHGTADTMVKACAGSSQTQ